MNTPNQFIDRLFEKYKRALISDNLDLLNLLVKLRTIKDTYGGKQIISPTGELKQLITKYL